MTRPNGPKEYEAIREMILKGKILPNERLIEADYAKLLDVNRESIRRALARLEQEGLVVLEPFRGARVRRITGAEALEIFEIRGVLEPLIVKHAVERATKADKLILEALREKLVATALKNDPMLIGSASRRLREELWRISGQSTAASILSTLNSQLVRIWFRSVAMPGRSEDIVTDLSEVVNGVVSGSAAKATKAMRHYHDGACAALKKVVGSSDESLDV